MAVARENADRLGADTVGFVASDWYSALSGQKFDLIVANPPYVAEGDQHLDALRFEPQQALVSGADGLDALRWVIQGRQRTWNLMAHWWSNTVLISGISCVTCSRPQGSRASRCSTTLVGSRVELLVD